MLAVEITVVYTYFTRIYIIVTVPCVLPGEILSVEDGPGQQQENSIVKITEIVRFLIRLKTISPLIVLGCKLQQQQARFHLLLTAAQNIFRKVKDVIFPF